MLTDLVEEHARIYLQSKVLLQTEFFTNYAYFRDQFSIELISIKLNKI